MPEDTSRPLVKNKNKNKEETKDNSAPKSFKKIKIKGIRAST